MTVETTIYFRHPSDPRITIEPTTITVSEDEAGNSIIVNIVGGGLPGAGVFDGFSRYEGTIRNEDDRIIIDTYLANPGMTVENLVGWYARIIAADGSLTTYPYPIVTTAVRLIPDVVERQIPTEGEILIAVEQLREGIALGMQGKALEGMELVSGTYATIEAALVPQAWDRKRARRYVLNVCGSYEIQQVFDVDEALLFMFAAAGSWDIAPLGLEKLDAILEQNRKG